MKKEKDESELDGCTFAPKIDSKSKQLANKNSKERSISFYKRNIKWAADVKNKASKKINVSFKSKSASRKKTEKPKSIDEWIQNSIKYISKQ